MKIQEKLDLERAKYLQTINDLVRDAQNQGWHLIDTYLVSSYLFHYAGLDEYKTDQEIRTHLKVYLYSDGCYDPEECIDLNSFLPRTHLSHVLSPR